jgi:type II secretory pathway pseudopilin PulG
MKKGFMLVEVMIAIIMAGVLAAVLATMGYYTLMQGNTLKQQNSKTMLEVIRSRLLNAAANPDNDSYFELLQEDTNNTVPDRYHWSGKRRVGAQYLLQYVRFR